MNSTHARFGEGEAEEWPSTLTAPLVGVDAQGRRNGGDGVGDDGGWCCGLRFAIRSELHLDGMISGQDKMV